MLSETAAQNADKQRRFSTYDASLGLQTSDNDDTVRKIRCSQLENRAKMRCSEYIIQQSASDIPLKRRRLLQCEESKYLDVPTTQHVPNRGMRTVSLNMEVTRRPDSVRFYNLNLASFLQSFFFFVLKDFRLVIHIYLRDNNLVLLSC